MIRINVDFGNGIVPVEASDDGTPLYPRDYWIPGIYETIAQAYVDGHWEPVPEPEPPPPEPDWAGFIIEFSLPGNVLYNATATKVQASGEVTIEHWSNLKLGLNISEIRSIEWLQLSYNYLLYLLEINNNPLSVEEKQSWVDLANKYNITIE